MSPVNKLISVAAWALNEEERAVRSRWQLLRKDGLWSRVGRGRAMGYPAPADISNLLISFLGGARATTAGDTVRAIREAPLGLPSPATVVSVGHFDSEIVGQVREEKLQKLPPFGLFKRLGPEHRFGEMLDGLFSEWRERGGLEGEVAGTFVDHFILGVEDGIGGYCGHLKLWPGDERCYELEYCAMDAITEDQSQRKNERLYRRSILGGGGPLNTMRTLSHHTIAALADCMSGQSRFPVTDSTHREVADARKMAHVQKTARHGSVAAASRRRPR